MVQHAVESRPAAPDRAPADIGAADLPHDEEEVSVWTLGAMVLRNGKLEVIVAGAAALLGLVLVALTSAGGPTYTTTASFISEDDGFPALGGAAELASRFGLTPAAGGAGSLQYYAELIRSRTLLGRVAGAEYPVATESGTRTIPLTDFAAGPDATPLEATASAVAWLRDRLNVEVNTGTGVVTFEVSAPDPELARQLADRILEEVHAHNIARRQTDAAAERRFIEDRLAAIGAELEESEAALAEFLRQNRQFDDSPELRIRFERLQRQTVMKQQVMTSLAQSYEQARIAEVRNTPVITVFEDPATPVWPDPRTALWVKALSVLLVAAVLGAVAAIIAGVLGRARAQQGTAYREFAGEWSRVRHRLGTLFGSRT